MNHAEIIAIGCRDLACVRDFIKCFPNVEHFIVPAKRQVPGEGWGIVSEWISRAKLHDRYIFWLVVAVEITDDHKVTAIEEPQVYGVDVYSIEKVKDEIDGPKVSVNFGQIEAGDWQSIVDAGGDFISAGFELITDQPVERFDSFWNDTRPHSATPAVDSVALKAPLRFMS
jgi:hypothetical protein